MYTDEDLESAVKEGIFTKDSVSLFRSQIMSSRETSAVDEENFRLISGFNDIFVVIACILLLFSASFALEAISKLSALILFPIIAWGLAEFFVLKRKMALPAIVLLFAFVGGVFFLAQHLVSSEIDSMIASVVAAIAAYLHYLRFRVPITVAVGVVAIIGFVVPFVLSLFPDSEDWLLTIVFSCGVIAFFFAMYWDSSDLQRVTYRSDVAFWIHLLSAPLIVHPIFFYIGVLDGKSGVIGMMTIILLYFSITIVSIAVDRRAFMVSSLAYVLYAISNLLKEYGAVDYSFAVTGFCIGTVLLLLSAFWQPTRRRLVKFLPNGIQRYLPETN